MTATRLDSTVSVKFEVKQMGLAVIESRWFGGLNTSIRPSFDQLSELLTGRNATYHYEMFNDATALKEIMLRVSNKRGIQAIYLAAHGWKKGIQGSNGQFISRRTLRNILRQVAAEGCRKTKGLYVGSCHFADEDTAHFILKSSMEREHPILWMAGYSKSVDFVEALCIDSFFINCWTKPNWRRGGEIARIRRVAKAIQDGMPGLAKKAGFNIYIRRPGDNGIEALLTY